MAVIPKRTKYRNVHRLPYDGKAKRNTKVNFGEYGLMAMEGAWITDRQIEAARVAINRFTKRGGRVWINVFPQKPVSKKPIGTRMGKGKGAPEFWVAVVKPGRVLFELEGVSEEQAREAMRLAGHKLPCKSKFIMKETETIEGGNE